MATKSVRRSGTRDPILIGLVMLLLGIILCAMGMFVNVHYQEDSGALIFVVGITFILFGFILGAFGFAGRKIW